MNYLLKNLLGSIASFIAITVLMFVLTSCLPGDPAKMLLGQHTNPETYEVIKQEMDYNKSLTSGVFSYLKNLVQGDWGRSWVSRLPVRHLISETLPITLKLCSLALIVALSLGLGFGALSAYRENTRLDKIIGTLSVAGFSVPHFWLALILQVLFGLIWKVLPVSGSGEGQFYFYILPGMAIGIPLGMAYIRLVRSILLTINNKPFIKAARSWGLPPWRVLISYGIPNLIYLLLIQVVTDAAVLLGGAVISETIFALPGIGSTLVRAVLTRDWPVVHGIVLVTTFMVLGLNLIVKTVAPLLDPRLSRGTLGGANLD